MSKSNSKIKSTLTLCVLLLQLSLHPLTQVLHVGCCHTSCATSQPEFDHAIQCSCCFHSGKKDTAAERRSGNSDSPGGQPHDQDSCAISQIAFAYCMPGPELQVETAAEAIAAGLLPELPQVRLTPRYRTPDRGPPHSC